MAQVLPTAENVSPVAAAPASHLALGTKMEPMMPASEIEPATRWT